MGNLPVVILAILLAAGLAACGTSRPRSHLISEADGARQRHWKVEDFPVTVVADPALPKAWIPHLKDAIASINAVIPDTMVWSDPGADVATYYDLWGYPPNGFLLVRSDNNTPHLGYTNILHTDGVIHSVVTQLRDDVVTSFLAPQTALHEVLHALGVAHEYSDDSVMNPVMTMWSTEFKASTKALLRRTYGR